MKQTAGTRRRQAMSHAASISVLLSSAILMLAASACASRVSAHESAPAAAAPFVIEGELGAKLNAEVESLASRGFAGSVLVESGGSIVLERGVGRAERSRGALTSDSRYWIASVSKQFTASAVLALVDDGRLSLDDPLTRFIADVPPDKASIRVHHLLSHTSGLENAYAADGLTDLDEAVRAILARPLSAPVGSRFEYAGDGYVLAAAIVEVVAREPFEDFVHRRLFERAGLHDTGFWGEAAAESVVPLRTRPERRLSGPNWGMRGGTGVYSTCPDLFRWWSALREGKVVSEASRALLFTPTGASKSLGEHGYGWFVSVGDRGGRVFRALGSEDTGNNSAIFVFPDTGETIIVLTHADRFEGSPAARVVAQRLAELLSR